MIGACTRMQTITLEEEIKLMDGVPYYFDFYQDFSCITLNGKQAQDVLALNLLELINETERENTVTVVDNDCSYEVDYQLREQLLKAAENQIKEERAWKEHNKKIGAKKAYKNWKRAVKDLGVDIE